jgi:SPP1 gp7 family putative phage head morphogenesis protein
LQLEIAFGRRIEELFDRIAKRAIELATARVRRLTEDAPSEPPARDSLARELEATIDFDLADAAALVGNVANHNARQMRRALRVMISEEREGLGLEIPELSRKNVRRLAKRTAREIRGIAESVSERIAPIVARAVSRGLRGSALADELTRRLGLEKEAAKRLAVGQVIRINSDVTRERHEALGITEYIWRSTDDEHTRAWHRKLNKSRQRYADPPLGGGGGPKDYGHPGSADVCRCQAIPVIP